MLEIRIAYDKALGTKQMVDLQMGVDFAPRALRRGRLTRASPRSRRPMDMVTQDTIVCREACATTDDFCPVRTSTPIPPLAGI